MENMDKGPTVAQWELINWPKVPQMPQNLSVQIICTSPKVWDFDEKWLHWASVSSINVETDQEFQLEFLAALNEREKK